MTDFSMPLDCKSAQSTSLETVNSDAAKAKKQKVLGGLFLTTVTVTSAGLGFSLACTSTIKASGKHGKAAAMDLSAFGFACKALGLGTVYAVAGVGLLTLGMSAMMGVRSLRDFRIKMEKFFKSNIPDIKRNEVEGRRDFDSFRQLFEYLGAGNESKR
uniref:Transmembrane protein 242 n=1 Tax=Romanomermis culicivorax TaxID=13658 RepID=A0A915ITU2_ROMCU